MPSSQSQSPANIILAADGRSLSLLDQTLLPNEVRYLSPETPEACFEAIASLRVRGAPAIGIFAALALAVLLRRETFPTTAALLARAQDLHDYLNTARPTAVNLSKMLGRLLRFAKTQTGSTVPALQNALLDEARAIQAEDIAMCRAIAALGLTLLRDGTSVLTHCNAGPLATSCYGTALGPLLLGQEQGYQFHVFCDETRPLLQGARLTSFELHRAGIPCTLICDNMASLVMQQGKVSACLVGCDRVARNGDTANKIGTSGLAILAQYYKIPFYVLGPSSTIDFSCPDGASIPIEEREGAEIKSLFFEKPSALPEIACYNPAFDVSPAALISAIVTERGICYPPYTESFAALFPREFEEGKP